jgi:predicted ABC-type ATPase
MRLIAGPNGAGKSTLIKGLKKENFSIGPFVNADVVERQLSQTGILPFKPYIKGAVSPSNWRQFLESKKGDRRMSESIRSLKIKDNNLFNERNISIDSYSAALIAEYLRTQLLEEKTNFTFETVMSHPSKVDFIKEAKQKSFKTYLYFICTRDPRINLRRVKTRAVKGGHDVSPEKIKSRFKKALDLLSSAFLASDRAFIIDNSEEVSVDSELKNNVILEKKGSKLIYHSQLIPEWVDTYILSKIQLK